jgi:hypothetical protein
MTAFIDIGLVYYYAPTAKTSLDKIMKSSHNCQVPNILDNQDTHPTRRVGWSERLVKTVHVKCEHFFKTLAEPVGHKHIYKYRDMCNTIDDDYDIDCSFVVHPTITRFGDRNLNHEKEFITFTFPQKLVDAAQLDVDSVRNLQFTFQCTDPNRVKPATIRGFTAHIVSHRGDIEWLSLKNYCDDGHIPVGFIKYVDVDIGMSNNNTSSTMSTTSATSTATSTTPTTTSKKRILESICIDPKLFLLSSPETYFYNPDDEVSDDDDY